MSDNSFKNHLFILFAFFILIILFSLFFYIFNVTIDTENSIILNQFRNLKTNKTITTPFYEKYNSVPQNGKQKFKINFKYKNKIKNPYLVLSLVYANGYKIYLNENYIGGLGDIEKLKSSIWTYTKIFNLSEHLDNDKVNELVILTNSNFQKGFGKAPFITSKNIAVKYFIINNFYNIVLPIISIGSLLFISIIFIIMNLFTFRNNYQNIVFLILSFIFLSLYFFDYLFIEYIPFSYLLFRKIIFVSLYLSNIFLLIGIFSYLKIKYSLISKLVITGYLYFIFRIILFTENMISLVETYRIGNILVVIFILLLVIKTFLKYYKTKDKKALIIFLASLFASPFFIHDIYIMVLAKEGNILSHFGLIFIYILLGAIIIYDFSKLYKRMKREKKKASLFYEDSLRDSLTDSFNRRILKRISKEDLPVYTVIMSDLDNFKEINDSYGHLIGDKVLQSISYIINNNIRESDYLIRYGGDEFLILLTNCNKKNAVKNAKEILSKIKNIKKIENYKLNINISMGIAEGHKNDRLSSIISKADSKLYQAKESNISIMN